MLSMEHPIGRFKAKFWMSFGYSLERYHLLLDGLSKHVYNDFNESEVTEFGVRYTIEAPIKAPDGRSPVVRSVWFIEKGSASPEFITAYPVKRRTK